MRALIAAWILLVPALAFGQPPVIASNDGCGATPLTVSVSGVQDHDAVIGLIGETAASVAFIANLADDEGVGNDYDAVPGTENHTTAGRGIVVWADYDVAAGDGTLSLTVTASAANSGCLTVVVLRPLSGGALGLNASTQFTQTGTPLHYGAPADGSFDTTAAATLLHACVGNSNFGSKGIDTTNGWEALDTNASTQWMAQSLEAAMALTDARPLMTSGTARDSWCAVIAVGESAPPSGGDRRGPGMLQGVGE